MSINEIINEQNANTDSIIQRKESLFWKAYEVSAYLLCLKKALDTCKTHWQAPAKPSHKTSLPISFSSSLRTLPLMAALGLPTHKINWFFVTNFNGMTKGLITNDSASFEKKYHLRTQNPVVNSKIYVNCRFRSDYVTNCAASTSVRFDRKDARNRQLHIFAERCT